MCKCSRKHSWYESPQLIYGADTNRAGVNPFFFFFLHLSPRRAECADKNTTREGEEILKQMKTGTQKEQYLYLHERECFAMSKSLVAVEVCNEVTRRDSKKDFLSTHIQHLFSAQNYLPARR